MEAGVKNGPLLVSVSTAIKTSISAPAWMAEKQGRGWPTVSAPREHDRATLLLSLSLQASLNTRVWRGSGLQGRGRLD